MIDDKALADKRKRYTITKRETVEEYLARGGKINGGPCPHPDVLAKRAKESEQEAQND